MYHWQIYCMYYRITLFKDNIKTVQPVEVCRFIYIWVFKCVNVCKSKNGRDTSSLVKWNGCFRITYVKIIDLPRNIYRPISKKKINYITCSPWANDREFRNIVIQKIQPRESVSLNTDEKVPNRF